MRLRIEMVEVLLGTWPCDKELASEFIIAKHPNGESAEETESVPVDESIEKASTAFPRDEDGSHLWDFQVKGFLKEACEQMVSSGTMTEAELKKYRLGRWMYKRTIDKQIFVMPRKIRLVLPSGGEMTWLERPLRGQTQKGERICLARSEAAPAGTTCEVEIVCLNKDLEKFVPKWLDYGRLFGLGQWRGGGFGRFEWEELSYHPHV